MPANALANNPRIVQIAVVISSICAGCSLQNTELPAPTESTLPELPGNEARGQVSAETPAPVASVSSSELSATTQPEWPIELDYTVLHKANFNPLETDNGKSYRALRSVAIYSNELARHSIETPKQVDFEVSQVLASSSGQRPSGGYSVGVTKLQETEDKVIATVTLVNPGPACITPQFVSFPFEFIVVPSRKPIEIFEQRKTNNC